MTPLALSTSVELWIALAIVFVLPPITIRLARSIEFGAWRLAVGYLLALLPLVIGFVLGARLPWRATITRPRAEGVASNSDRLAMIQALGDAATGPPSGH